MTKCVRRIRCVLHSGKAAALLLLASALQLSQSVSGPVQAATVPVQGVVIQKYFGSFTSGTVEDLFTDPRFPGSPDYTTYEPLFEYPPANGPYVFPAQNNNEAGDNYANELSGLLIAPVTGNYVFFICSDDQSELFLSTDETTANKKLIATETAWSNPRKWVSSDGGSDLPSKRSDQFPSSAWPGATGTGATITLTAGKSYYIEAIHREGGGGDNVSVLMQLPGAPTPKDGDAPIDGKYIQNNVDTNGISLAITQQPATVSVLQNGKATFSVRYTANSSFFGNYASVQWQKNGTNIPGATSQDLVIPLANLADNGAKYHAVISIASALTATSSDAVLNVSADTIPPIITQATGNTSLSAATIAFDGPVDPATATNAANYAISPTLAVTGATLQDASTVVLSTASQSPSSKYTVTVNNVKDLAGNTIAANTKKDFYAAVFVTGTATMNYWYNVTGNTIANLQADPRFPNSPSFSALLKDWEYPPYNGPWVAPATGNNEAGDNYGNNIVGWFIPPTTGNYVFFTCSDDPSNLYLSTDDNPANKKLIAQEGGWSNPRSWTSTGSGDATTKRSDQFTGTEWPGGNTIALTAGKKYYMESQHTEGGGGDSVEATFIIAGNADPTDGDPSALTNSVIATTIPANGIIGATSPTGADILPTAGLSVQIVPGLAQFNSSTVTLKLDNAAVTPKFQTNGTTTTISFAPATPFVLASTHQVELDYPLADGSTGTNTWNFSIVKAQTKDSVKGILGYIKGPGGFTADAGGHTGKSGDYAIDSTKAGGTWVDIPDVSFINAAAPNDKLSAAFWLKKYDIVNGSAFWAQLGSNTNGTDMRGFQAHVPWSDDTIYFDTMGCCDTSLSRIDANINTFTPYNNVGSDAFWTNWHHFVFTKNGDQKNIYIDGQLFLNGSSTAPLQPNFVELGLLTDGVPGGDFMHGLIDDFAVFSSEVSAADAAKLASGTSPTALTGETLVAYWSFDDATSSTTTGGGGTGGGTISISGSGSSLKITFTGAIQSADTVNGPWTDVSGASPLAVTPSGSAKFYRTKP